MTNMPTNQELQNKIDAMQKDIDELKRAVGYFIGPDRFYVKRDLQFPISAGAKIAKSKKEMLSFWGVDPIVQPATVSDPTINATTGFGTVDVSKVDNNFSSLNTAVTTIIDRLQAIGLIST